MQQHEKMYWYRDIRQPGYIRMKKKIWQTVEYSDKHNQPQSNSAHMGGSHTHGVWAAALGRSDMCMFFVMYLVYV